MNDIAEVGKAMIMSDGGIKSRNQLQHKASAFTGQKVSLKLVGEVMREQLSLSWQRIRKTSHKQNSGFHKVRRRYFAKELLSQFEQGHIIVNVDETAINYTSTGKYMWRKRTGPGRILSQRIIPGLTLFLAAATTGDLFAAVV